MLYASSENKEGKAIDSDLSESEVEISLRFGLWNKSASVSAWM